MFALVLLDLTLREVLGDIPHDAGAIVAYLMIGLFIAFTVAGSRGRGAEDRQVSPEE